MRDVSIYDNNINASNGGLIRVDGAKYWDTKDVHIYNNSSTSSRLIFLNMGNLDANAQFDSWTIKDNSTSDELLFLNSGTTGKKITFQNMLLVNNTAQNRPGLVLDNYRGTYNFINTIIADNSATNTGNYSAQFFANYAASNDNPIINVFNSIIEGNNGYSFSDNDWNTDAYTLNIENSYIQGGSSAIDVQAGTKNYGTSNISSGIYFKDAANGDYAPSHVSAALGAGASSTILGGASLSAPVLDIYGNPRPNPCWNEPRSRELSRLLDSIPNVGIAAVVTNNGFCQTTSGAITANLLNYSGTGGVAYSWTSLANSNSSPSVPTTQQTGLASGDYAVVAAKDASDGTVLDSIVVTDWHGAGTSHIVRIRVSTM